MSCWRTYRGIWSIEFDPCASGLKVVSFVQSNDDNLDCYYKILVNYNTPTRCQKNWGGAFKFPPIAGSECNICVHSNPEWKVLSQGSTDCWWQKENIQLLLNSSFHSPRPHNFNPIRVELLPHEPVPWHHISSTAGSTTASPLPLTVEISIYS